MTLEKMSKKDALVYMRMGIISYFCFHYGWITLAFIPEPKKLITVFMGVRSWILPSNSWIQSTHSYSICVTF
jgi:hypothetical protein